ncbi:class A beta-lactamase [Ideonella sp. 4Y11]|uniref:Beta-lactamase n=1 Tax=Ideonella aquatica TaxID=2824119 RepID=A0A940YPV3_9BURK|nr:class A beta-lactamase [Ideonella aquatica]MBQ0959813.1 class A beta-lactamase [Ideonella aquatica]
METTRRHWISTLLATLAAPALGAVPDALAALERRQGGRLGVALQDLAGGPGLAHRADERFALCSTFKLWLAAATLAQVDAGRWRLDERLHWDAADAVPHMPVVATQDPRAGMTLAALAEAAQCHSDNLAANLLLRHLGGPQALTAWLRTQGDHVTRLDRPEPAMNQVRAGDEQDTTTPAAIAANLVRLLRGDMLGAASRERLLGWMRATRTGQRRLRAGLPAGWTAGDKTGTGLDDGLPDRINDVAIVWPPGGRAPRVVAAYYEGPLRGSRRVRPQDEAVLAAVGRLVAR